MTYFTVDDGFDEHPKVVGLSDSAIATWVRGMCYCSRQLTDGAIVSALLPRLGKPKVVAELVDAGLWERTETGIQVHDYHERQRTKAEVDILAATKAQAGTLGNHKRWHVKRRIVAKDCKWCRKSIAACDASGNRETSPESEADTEADTESEPSAKTHTPSLGLRVDGAMRDGRVVDCLKLLGGQDMKAEIELDPDKIKRKDKYLAACIESRDRLDGETLDILAERYPDHDAAELAHELSLARAHGGTVSYLPTGTGGYR